MPALREIGLSGVSGLRPTPVQQVVINNYFAHDELLNILQFVPIGMGNTLGNFVASFVISDGDVEATFRELGVNYEAENQNYNVETVQLKMLGGALNADRAVQRAFGAGSTGLDTYTEGQIVQKLNAIKKAFAKWFILGNSKTDAKQFDGLEAKIKSTQIVTDALDFTDLDFSKAANVERGINYAIALMKKAPTFWLTTRRGKSNLVTLNSIRYKGVETINVNDMNYKACMGLPVVAVDDDCFKTEDTTNKMPVYGIYTNDYDGIRVAIPNDLQIVDILRPQFLNGKVVQDGTCEMICAPILVDRLAVCKFFIKDTVA